jgi:hypothetical protein
MALNFVKTLFSNAKAFMQVTTTASATAQTTMTNTSVAVDMLPLGFMKTLFDQIIAASGGEDAYAHQSKADVVHYLIKSSGLSAEDFLYTIFIMLAGALYVLPSLFLLSLFVIQWFQLISFLLAKVINFIDQNLIYNGANHICSTVTYVINCASEVDHQAHIQRFCHAAVLVYNTSRVRIQRFGHFAAISYGMVKIQMRAMITWFDTWLKDIYVNSAEPRIIQMNQQVAEVDWNEFAHSWNNFLQMMMIDTTEADVIEIINAPEAIKINRLSDAICDIESENITGNVTAALFLDECQLTPDSTDDEWEVDEHIA